MVVGCCLAFSYGHFLGVELDDAEGVAEVVDAAVGEELAFHDEATFVEFPGVVLLGGVLDGGGDAMFAALEAGLERIGVDDPGADDVVLLPVAEKGVGADRKCENDGQGDSYGVESLSFLLVGHSFFF